MESEVGIELDVDVDRDARDEAVQAYFERFARALTAGDGATLATMWKTPAFVMADGMAQTVDSPHEVEVFFSGAKDQYEKRGITDTRAEIEAIQWVTAHMVMVQVRWPYLDEEDDEIGGERSTYVLSRADDGSLAMRVVLMHGAFESDA